MDNKYKDYFDIDPDYFPAVNPDVIKSNPELWKKFYPHETFIKLIKDIVSVLNRQQKQNIWVEGAYGTGKSHAVLTLKHLLDSTEQETKEYFETFNLDQDLLKKFLYVKSEGKIITVHRYASSSIKGDNDLFIAIQESIEQALRDAGIDNAAHGAMKDAVVKYLSDEYNKQYFNGLVTGPYASLFGGSDADKIIKDLQEYTEDALRELMRKIFKVANERQIRAFTLDDKGLCEWIRETIRQNKLNAIVFIWDEFTEYFQNNMTALTGFQTMLELSETEHFCFIPVTHKSEALFSAQDTMKNKILGRFVRPRCVIELPENMAFQLMGAAMQKNSDPVIYQEWTEEILPDLCDRTVNSRVIVGKQTKLNDEQMRGILPIHPYAAKFVDFYNNRQNDVFKKVCDFELTGLSDADKDKVYGAMPMGCFTKDKVGYSNLVAQMVEEQKKGLNSMKLRNIWREKTNTSSPYQWSEQFSMPIFAMLAEQEVTVCRKIFATINSNKADAKDISDAITYLENAKFFDFLNDASQRDKMFVKNIIRDNAVMLSNIAEVKDYLRSHVTDVPYYWFGSPSVQSTLNKMAEAKYNKDGYEIAFQKIDQMSAEDVKKYLKDLIKNNKNVGVEIIKNN